MSIKTLITIFIVLISTSLFCKEETEYFVEIKIPESENVKLYNFKIYNKSKKKVIFETSTSNNHFIWKTKKLKRYYLTYSITDNEDNVSEESKFSKIALIPNFKMAKEINTTAPSNNAKYSLNGKNDFIKLTFSWEEVKDSVYYKMNLSLKEDFSKNIYELELIENETEILLPPGKFYWQIKAVYPNKKEIVSETNFIEIEGSRFNRKIASMQKSIKKLKADRTLQIKSNIENTISTSNMALNFQYEDYKYKKLGINNIFSYNLYTRFNLSSNLAGDLNYNYTTGGGVNTITYSNYSGHLYPVVIKDERELIYFGLGAFFGNMNLIDGEDDSSVNFSFYNFKGVYERKLANTNILNFKIAFGSNIDSTQFAYLIQFDSSYTFPIKFFNSKKLKGQFGLGYDATSVAHDDISVMYTIYSIKTGLSYDF